MEMIFAYWKEMLGFFGINHDCRGEYDLIEKLYGIPPRAYHNFSGHIGHCLTELERSRPSLGPPSFYLLVFSLMIHDIFLNPEAKDNEQRSAAFAVQSAFRIGLDFLAEPSYRLIMSTSKHLEVSGREDGSEKVMRDIDLAILGQDWPRYDRYRRQIREEYSHLEDGQFGLGRSRFMRKLLNREPIYLSVCFREKYEFKARNNIQHELYLMEGQED